MCPIKDDGDASILYLNVTPKAIPQGTYHELKLYIAYFYIRMYDFITGDPFEIAMSFKTVNGTGIGEIDMLVHTQDGIPVGQLKISEPHDPGTYTVKWDGEAKPDPDCDPTQSFCEMWIPGNYSVKVGKAL